MAALTKITQLGALLVTVASVSVASADEHSGNANGAALGALPAGHVSPPPRTKAPASIPGGEKVPGFFVIPQKAGKGQRSEYVNVFSTARSASQINDGTAGTSLALEACFTEDQSDLRRGVVEDADPSWSANLRSSLTLGNSFQYGQRPVVTAVHSERFSEEEGKPTLEVVDAWVDPQTRGARLISRASVPLELVSTLFGGTRVYAARDSQLVQVVLVGTHDKKRMAQDSLFAIADGNVGNSACNHIRVALKVEKGQGRSATFIANAELPSLEAPKTAPPVPAEVAPAESKTLQARIRLLQEQQQARVRPMHVNASVTWPSREKEALLTVSAGWDSRERAGFVF